MNAMSIAILALALFAATRAHLYAAPLPSSCKQLVVGIADAWDASAGHIQFLEREGGAGWRAASPPMRVLFGKNGLAWGIGVAGQDESGRRKAENDKRAPAGIFKIGKIYTYDNVLPSGADYPFYQVTANDAWIEDPALPNYNRHVVVDASNPPPWFKKQQMRQNDPPHRWKIEIRHNADLPTPGAGSAIFFHIQRGPDRTSAGCTTMPMETIFKLMRWLRSDANPHYALLPREEYLARWTEWRLPPPASISDLSDMASR